MALSNALSNSILKPGVCTSSARPSNPYEGQFIYETDTDALLVYNGSSWICPSGPSSDPTLANQFTRKSYVDSLHTTAYNRGSLGVTNAATAQTAASNAQTTANAAMPKAGGTFTGTVNMGSQVLYLRSGYNSQNYLWWQSGSNSAELAGYSSVRIYVSSTGQLFTFKDNGIATAPSSWYDSSSIRFKENILELEPSGISDSIDLLRPVSYTYKEEHSKNSSNQIGFIAEEVAEIIPEVVEYDEDGLPCAISYSRLSVIALSEIKSLRERLKKLEEKIDELSRRDS